VVLAFRAVLVFRAVLAVEESPAAPSHRRGLLDHVDRGFGFCLPRICAETKGAEPKVPKAEARKWAMLATSGGLLPFVAATVGHPGVERSVPA
jgi:hypothetical protein